MLLGAGTVAKASEVEEVLERGGQLIVTPNANTAVVLTSREAGLFVTPEFFTPTEAFELLDAGADAIRMFPSEVLGISMLKALRAVLPSSAGVIPVGVINPENISGWMAAGAVDVGAGTSINRLGDTAVNVQRKARAL